MPICVEDFPKDFFFQHFGVFVSFRKNMFSNILNKIRENSTKFPAGYWKATGPNKLIGGVHKLPIFVEDFPKEILRFFRKIYFFAHFGKIPLENPLQKSATCVPLPINLFGPVAFQ